MSNEALSNLLRRTAGSRRPRTSPPTPTSRPTRTPRPRPTGWRSGPTQARRLAWDTALDRDTGLVEHAVRQVVRRRQAERRLQLRGPARRGRQRRPGRHPLRGRARRLAARSPTPSSRTRCAKAANALTELGVSAGDRVAIYMPMIPETAWRCWPAPASARRTRWSSRRSPPTPCASRIEDAGAKLLITADGYHRRGGMVNSRPNADEAVAARRRIENVLVVTRTGQDVAWDEGRDVWWHESVGAASPPSTPRRRSTPSTRCSSSTPPAPRVSPRASCTPPAAT